MYVPANTYVVLVNTVLDGRTLAHFRLEKLTKQTARRFVREITALAETANATSDLGFHTLETPTGELASFQPGYLASVHMQRDEEWVDDVEPTTDTPETTEA